MNWKCILPALIFCVLLSVPLSAQQRHCDLKVTLLSPAEGQVIQPLAHFDIKVNIENLGPDDLLVGDTLYYNTSMDVSFVFDVFYLNQDIPAGQSADLLLDNVANVNTNPADEVVNFCGRVIDKPDTLNNGSFEDSSVSNNFDCNQVTLISGETGITTMQEDQLFTIYPNPASNNLYIQFPETGFRPTTISIMDMSGRVLKQFNTPDAGSEKSLDISELSSGIYFLKCSNGSQDAFLKFVKH